MKVSIPLLLIPCVSATDAELLHLLSYRPVSTTRMDSTRRRYVSASHDCSASIVLTILTRFCGIFVVYRVPMCVPLVEHVVRQLPLEEEQ